MPHVLVLFLDGVGLGSNDPNTNPLCKARMPNLTSLLDGRKLIMDASPYNGDRASLYALDTTLGIPGLPQSATGQAVLLTGRNVPEEIGEHYGPKPNPAVANLLKENNLFMHVLDRGGSTALLNAYPPRYFEAITNRRRLYSAIPMAAHAAGLELMTAEDLQAGRAMSPDFTGDGWSSQPGFPPAPVYSADEAGKRLADLSQKYSLTWFDYWLSDYAGHRGGEEQAILLLETFDVVLGGLIRNWEMSQDLIIITSDHGNLEDLSARGHTTNPVPLLLIGSSTLRQEFAQDLSDLTSFYSGVLRVLDSSFPS
jgi:2,3-bisphosphoglycerate-independent phosphoglycerate mutase